jgi:hypothetical protein
MGTQTKLNEQALAKRKTQRSLPQNKYNPTIPSKHPHLLGTKDGYIRQENGSLVKVKVGSGR